MNDKMNMESSVRDGRFVVLFRRRVKKRIVSIRNMVRIPSLVLAFMLCGGICRGSEVHDAVTMEEVKEKKSDFVNFSDVDRGYEDLGLMTNPKVAAEYVISKMTSSLQDRMTNMFEKATSTECRIKIGQHFNYFVGGSGQYSSSVDDNDVSMPFSDLEFSNECPEEKVDWDNLPPNKSMADFQFRTYQPPKNNETDYIDHPDHLNFLYAILTHEAPESTIRLIEALYEPGHIFVVHVDAKEKSESTYQALTDYFSNKSYVHLLPHPYRVRVNWGGFSMVNATLQILQYSFGLLDESAYCPEEEQKLQFHKVIHLASTSYPISSNTKIRQKLASYPLDANFFNIIMRPTNPSSNAWHYFVECDDALHRIYRLPPLVESQNGIDIYTSSQWFIISRQFAHYLATAEPGSLVHQFLPYAEHIVVADETFFGTVFRHSKYCTKHHNTNFLHLEFDSWENEMDVRDPRKCVMPEPDRCGRSPTTLTMDYLPVLELSEDLFARKFSDGPSQIKDVLDDKRAREEVMLQHKASDSENLYKFDPSFEGEGILIVAKETLKDDMPLCMGLGPEKNKVKLLPCFHEWVPKTLAPGWEGGAVIIQETLMHNRWELGPCSSDGNLTRTVDGQMLVTPGNYTSTGPRCMLRQRDGPRRGRCIDIESDKIKPGGELQVYPCFRKWHQFLSFGNGEESPKLSMHFSVPTYMLKRAQRNHSVKHLEPHLCIGIYGRNRLEQDLDGVTKEDILDPKHNRSDFFSDDIFSSIGEDNKERLPLSKWGGKRLLSVSCKDKASVIEWLIIPYILETDEEDESSEKGQEKAVEESNETEDEEL